MVCFDSLPLVLDSLHLESSSLLHSWARLGPSAREDGAARPGHVGGRTARYTGFHRVSGGGQFGPREFLKKSFVIFLSCSSEPWGTHSLEVPDDFSHTKPVLKEVRFNLVWSDWTRRVPCIPTKTWANVEHRGPLKGRPEFLYAAGCIPLNHECFKEATLQSVHYRLIPPRRSSSCQWSHLPSGHVDP